MGVDPVLSQSQSQSSSSSTGAASAAGSSMTLEPQGCPVSIMDIDLDLHIGLEEAQGSTSPAMGSAAPAVNDSCGTEGRESHAQSQSLALLQDGSSVASKVQSDWLRLTLDVAEPGIAGGIAFFGLGALVLPLVAALRNNCWDHSSMFSYDAHCDADGGRGLRLYTEKDLKERFGLVDIAFKLKELRLDARALDAHISQSSSQDLKREVRDIHRWRESASSALKLLQRRAAFSFLGLATDATEGDINKVYKKLALELHPDKGGDPEKFSLLQEMRQRTLETDKSKPNDEKDGDDDVEVDMGDKPDLKMMRWQAHRSVVQLWEDTNKTVKQIRSIGLVKGDQQQVLHVLRMFVMSFVNHELVAPLEDGDSWSVKEKLGNLIKTGAEIIAVSSVIDAESTHSILSTHLGGFLVAHGCPIEARRMYASLLWATLQVKTQVCNMLSGREMTVTPSSTSKDTVRVAAPEDQEHEEGEDLEELETRLMGEVPPDTAVAVPIVVRAVREEAQDSSTVASLQEQQEEPVVPIVVHAVKEEMQDARFATSLQEPEEENPWRHEEDLWKQVITPKQEQEEETSPATHSTASMQVDAPRHAATVVPTEAPANQEEMQDASSDASPGAPADSATSMQVSTVKSEISVALSNNSIQVSAVESQIAAALSNNSIQVAELPESEQVLTFAPPPFQLGPYEMHLKMIDQGAWEKISADVFEGKTLLGHLQGTFITRGPGAFYDACCSGIIEEDSQAAQFFDNDGCPAESWKSHAGPRACGGGGLVFLEQLRVEHPDMHRGSAAGLASEMVQAVLRCLAGPMKRVTLVVWMPGATSVASLNRTISLGPLCESIGFQPAVHGQGLLFLEVGGSKRKAKEAHLERRAKRRREAEKASKGKGGKENSAPVKEHAKGRIIRPPVSENMVSNAICSEGGDTVLPASSVPYVAFNVKFSLNAWEKLTPRVRYALGIAVGTGAAALQADAARFTSGKPGGHYWGCEWFPARLRQNVFKAYVNGFAEMIALIGGLLQAQQAPTVDTLSRATFAGHPGEEFGLKLNKHFLSHFFGVGGTVESAMLAIVKEASTFCEVCESIHGQGDEDAFRAYHALPIHMLDGDFEFVRSVLGMQPQA